MTEFTTMSKHDLETQRIIVVPQKSGAGTEARITPQALKTDGPKSQQETQRISSTDSANFISVHLNPQELRSLPFGTLKLDAQGQVLRYNPFSAATGPSPDSIQGKNFFQQVITFETISNFSGRYYSAVKTKELYAEFKFHITCEGSKPIDVQITLYYSKNSDSFWALINRAPAESR
jgi:photoactive yellow protein